MAEILQKALADHLAAVDRGKDPFASVYLLHGDEYLYKQALAKLLDALLPEAERSIRCTIMDGSDASLQQALNELNTYALLPGRKVVVISETRVFYSQKNKGALLEKSRGAAAAGRLKAAATPFVAYLALVGWTLEDVAAESAAGKTLLSQWGEEEAAGLAKLIEYCRGKGLGTDAGGGGADLLAAAMEKGFPSDHHLVLTADLIDKRRKLFKLIKADGVIVDCSVPKGSRFADKQAQEQVLRGHAKTLLAPSGKTLAPQVFEYVCEVTGFDLRTFTQNIEKLADFTGDRAQITIEDARRVLARTRSDPIFELTNALFLRDADGALFYLRSMLRQEMQPLQILGAIVNQLRKVLIAREFVSTAGRGVWRPGMPFAHFKTAVMPVLQKYDQALADQLIDWSASLRGDASPAGEAKSKAKTKALQSELVLAKSPQSAYPVYQLLLKADKFSRDDLLAAMEKAQQTDRLLKGSRLAPALILEDLLLSICRP